MFSKEEILDDAIVNGRVPTIIRDVVVRSYDSMMARFAEGSDLKLGEMRQICGLSMLTRASVSMFKHGMWHHMPSALGFERGADGFLYTAAGDRVIGVLEDALTIGSMRLKDVRHVTRNGSLHDIMMIDAIMRTCVDPRIAFGSCDPAEGTSIIGTISHLEAAMEMAAGVQQDEIAFAVLLGAAEGKFSPGLSMENAED